jgi:hypothetical protein
MVGHIINIASDDLSPPSTYNKQLRSKLHNRSRSSFVNNSEDTHLSQRLNFQIGSRVDLDKKEAVHSSEREQIGKTLQNSKTQLDSKSKSEDESTPVTKLNVISEVDQERTLILKKTKKDIHVTSVGSQIQSVANSNLSPKYKSTKENSPKGSSIESRKPNLEKRQTIKCSFIQIKELDGKTPEMKKAFFK